MNKVTATYQKGNVVLDSTVDWPDGTRVTVVAEERVSEDSLGHREDAYGIADDDWPETQIEIEKWLEWFQSRTPPSNSDGTPVQFEQIWPEFDDLNREAVREQFDRMDQPS